MEEMKQPSQTFFLSQQPRISTQDALPILVSSAEKPTRHHDSTVSLKAPQSRRSASVTVAGKAGNPDVTGMPSFVYLFYFRFDADAGRTDRQSVHFIARPWVPALSKAHKKCLCHHHAAA